LDRGGEFASMLSVHVGRAARAVRSSPAGFRAVPIMNAGDVSVIQSISLRRLSRWFRRCPPLVVSLLAIAGALLVRAGSAAAADLRGGWGDWWLPPDRSIHGSTIDSLFLVTFWITMVTFVVFEITLV